MPHLHSHGNRQPDISLLLSIPAYSRSFIVYVSTYIRLCIMLDSYGELLYKRCLALTVNNKVDKATVNVAHCVIVEVCIIRRAGDTILAVLNRYEDMKVCAEDLVYMANENGGNDNISVICIDLED